MQGYYLCGAGRCHQACEILVANRGGSAQIKAASGGGWVDAKKVTVLKDNQRFVSILWAGGWDEYVVGVDQIRPMTEKEINDGKDAVKNGHGLPPLIYEGEHCASPCWLKGAFAKNVCKDFQCVKVVRHIAGGD